MIQKALQDPLAELLLAGALRDGEVLKVGAGPDGLLFGERAVQAERAAATVH